MKRWLGQREESGSTGGTGDINSRRQRWEMVKNVEAIVPRQMKSRSAQC